jgi:hypothetical protein
MRKLLDLLWPKAKFEPSTNERMKAALAAHPPLKPPKMTQRKAAVPRRPVVPIAKRAGGK